MRLFRSARARVLTASVLLLAGSAVASVVAMRFVFLARLDQRIDRELVQEADEFRRLQGGVDPETGEPFGTDAVGIFDVYLTRNVPGEDEVLFTMVGDEPYRRSANAPYPLEDLDSLVARWAATNDAQLQSGRTPVGEVRYVVLPVVAAEERLGTYVVARFPSGERAEVDDAVRSAAAVAGGTLLVASLAAWAIAGRVLAPLRSMAETARAITSEDLTRRIPTGGTGELAELTTAFNSMLDRLQALYDSQRSFLDDAGHELRTPLTILRGHLEMADPRAPLDGARRALLFDEIDRMTRMVEDLLVLATADRPDFVLREPVDVADLLAEVLAKARPMGPRSWTITDTAAVVASLDRHRVTQALMNLIRNAIQHTVDHAAISLSSRVEGSWLRLTVTDTGEGLAKAEQARIFERFARANSTHRSRTDGAGLGLAITAAIAEAHGGRVELISAPGEGAAFSLLLPIVEETSDCTAS